MCLTPFENILGQRDWRRYVYGHRMPSRHRHISTHTPFKAQKIILLRKKNNVAHFLTFYARAMIFLIIKAVGAPLNQLRLRLHNALIKASRTATTEQNGNTTLLRHLNCKTN